MFFCKLCKAKSEKAFSRCAACGKYQTCEKGGPQRTMLQAGEAVRINEIDLEGVHRIQTGTREFDRVLGGDPCGLVQGSLILIGGEPGKGKSTICLQVGCELAEAEVDPCTVLYVSGEETPKQVRERAERIMMDIKPTKMFFMAETNLSKIAEKVLSIDPDILIIDSIQTMRVPEASTGSHSQLVESTKFLTGMTKARGLTTMIISHVNKDGDLAGPKAVEHYVDVVLSFDAERSSDIRTLRALKNRFGDTTEVGIFRMTSEGLKSVDNPSEHLIRGKRGAPGSCLACVMLNPGEGVGTRAMLFEVQALVSPPAGKSGVRVSQGYESKRLDMVLAILAAHTSYGAAGAADIYVNVTPAGFSIDQASLDLPVALAICSSLTRTPIPPGIVAWGEMGLTGEVRPDDYGALRSKLAVATAMKFKSPLYSTREAIQHIADALAVLPKPENITEEKLAEMGVKKAQ